MNELLQAAKAVIDTYEYTGTAKEYEAVNRLHEAVERAEKPSADFMEWWKTFPLNTYGIVPAFHGWTAAQQAERERIKEIIATLGVSGIHDMWFDCCDTILNKIDE